MTTLDFIMLVEDGGFNPKCKDQKAALQEMIDTGLVWKLQGSWQKFAKTMIEKRFVKMKSVRASAA